MIEDNILFIFFAKILAGGMYLGYICLIFRIIKWMFIDQFLEEWNKHSDKD